MTAGADRQNKISAEPEIIHNGNSQDNRMSGIRSLHSTCVVEVVVLKILYEFENLLEVSLTDGTVTIPKTHKTLCTENDVNKTACIRQTCAQCYLLFYVSFFLLFGKRSEVPYQFL